VLDDVSLAIDEGERAGLIGSNGSGKSTLGKILAGLEQSEGGSVAPRKGLEVGYLAQEPVLDESLTAFEEVERGLADWRAATARYELVGEKLARGEGDADALLAEQSLLAAEIERLGGWDQGHKVRAMLEHLGIVRPTQRIVEMSGGERRRVALARMLVARPGLMILDEPTNHLDADTAEWLEDHLVNDFPGALLLITHDRYFLDAIVSRVFELDRGSLFTFEGNYARYLELKAERLEHEARVESNRLNVLRREREWLSHQAPARTTKQKARIQRAGALETTLRDSRRSSDKTLFQVASVRTGKRLIETKGLAKSYGDKTLFENVDLLVGPGERIGIIGRNGSGKTTFLRVLLGDETADRGEVIRGANTKVMYFDQHRAGLDEGKSVYENVAEGSDKVQLGDQWISAHAYLDRFLFDGAKQRQSVDSLSGGERARLALAKMLRGGANLIVLDEPTNDLDLVTLATLEELLTGFDGAVLCVTHDRWFLNRTVTSIVSFEDAGRVVQYAGHYEDYRVQRAAMDATRAEKATAAASDIGSPGLMRGADARPGLMPGARGEAPARGKRLTLGEEKELAGLPARIDAAEHEVAHTEAQLNDPTLYTKRRDEVARLQGQLEAARAALDELMARWEVLEGKRGA
jgi:ATP-binding cassette subfamily F protein uup